MNVLNRVMFFLAAFIMNACLSEADMKEYQFDPEEVAPVQIIKGKQGWSGSRALIAGANSSYSIQAEFSEIGQYTVQFGISDLPPATGDGQYKAQAEVIWSVQGNSVRRLVNCADGISISGTAEAVSVKILDTSELDGADPFEYVVNVQIAPGTRASVQQPPVFENQARRLIDIGSFARFNVPRDAGVISVYLAVGGSLEGQISVTPIEPGAIRAQHGAGASSFKFYDPRAFQWVPLSPGTDYVDVNVAPGSSQAVYVTAVWGIDG